MAHTLSLIQVETRKLLQINKSYYVQLVADQIFFILGFLLLTGLFEVATDGQYTGEAQLASLIGYLTWRVAGGGMVGVTDSIAEDAQWGTLEQVWLSGSPPTLILFARSVALTIYYTIRVLVIAAIIMLLLRTPTPNFHGDIPGAVVIYLITLSGVFGLALLIAGLHLVYKNVSAITFPLATMLLFLTGALSPLDGIPALYILSRFLPLSFGIDLLRDLLVNGETLVSIASTPAFLGLMLNSAVYLGAGWFGFGWARKKALSHGSLAHY